MSKLKLVPALTRTGANFKEYIYEKGEKQFKFSITDFSSVNKKYIHITYLGDGITNQKKYGKYALKIAEQIKSGKVPLEMEIKHEKSDFVL